MKLKICAGATVLAGVLEKADGIDGQDVAAQTLTNESMGAGRAGVWMWPW